MGNGAINVAYEGTLADLSPSEAAAGIFANGSAEFHHFVAQMAQGGFTAINSNNPSEDRSGLTVSPKDIFTNDSVPPSASYSHLTTPGSTFMDTPDEDYQTSPLFSDNLALDPHASAVDQWYSLFPEEQTPVPVAPVMARTTSTSSATQIMVHPGGEGNPRKRSIAPSSASPTSAGAAFSPATKLSAVAGVNARKRDKPLPPIVVNDDDPVALKRARNTAAARKSRAKKVEERDGFEAEIAALKAQVAHWKKVAVAHGATPPVEDE